MQTVHSLKGFQKILSKAGEMQLPWVAWNEVDMPRKSENMAPAHTLWQHRETFRTILCQQASKSESVKVISSSV